MNNVILDIVAHTIRGTTIIQRMVVQEGCSLSVDVPIPDDMVQGGYNVQQNSKTVRFSIVVHQVTSPPAPVQTAPPVPIQMVIPPETVQAIADALTPADKSESKLMKHEGSK